MKAQRRHELQRNALEVEILKLWEFLRRKGNYLAWGALGVAAVVLAAVWYVKRSGSDAETVQALFTRCALMPPSEQREQGLQTVASSRSQPFWASLADVELANDVALRLVTQWPGIGEAERMDLRRQAETYYQKAISEFPKEELAVAKAHYGLGKLAEDWGELEKARVEYEEVLRAGTTAEILKGQPILYVAQDARTKLPLYQGTVNMPTSAAASGPSSEPASGPSSGPAASLPGIPATAPAARVGPPPAGAQPASAGTGPSAAGPGGRPGSAPASRPAESD